VIAFEKELEKREADYKAELQKRYVATLKKPSAIVAVAITSRAVLDARKMPDAQLQTFLRERDLTPFRVRPLACVPLRAVQAVVARVPSNCDSRRHSEKDFAEKSPELIAGLAKNPKMAGNPLVLKALTDDEAQDIQARRGSGRSRTHGDATR